MKKASARYLLLLLSAVMGMLCAAMLRADDAPPRDNPVAAYYSGDEGYPAWTDRIRWDRVIDMSQYAKGRTHFERFENARDELASQGGGVLYYPAGEYDFSEGPFDGPRGRGLMLRSGVVLRGETPRGKPKAVSGSLDLPTKFRFGFQSRANAIETGERASVWLEGALFIESRDQRNPVRLQLALPVNQGQIQTDGAAAYAQYHDRQEHPVRVRVTQSGDAIRLEVQLTAGQTVTRQEGGERITEEQLRDGAYTVTLTRRGDELTGSFDGTFDGQPVRGAARGAFFDVVAETPRDWNLIGLLPEAGRGVKDVDTVGVCWIHLSGGVIYFGPQNDWGPTWRTAGSWKSDFVKDRWAGRIPDGTHPWDPLTGGGKTHVGSGDGRLIFGCVLEHAVGMNDAVTMGRPDTPAGFGQQGYYMAKFTPRIGVYGSRVFVANNVLAKSTGRNFKYRQLTRYTHPGGRGNSMAFGDESVRPVLFDYNKAAGIDNKVMLGLTESRSPEESAGRGYFVDGIVVRDNYVYNHGHKGFNLTGNWVTITGNRNERDYLRESVDPYFIGGWELTLDGYLQSSPGGNGAISDNLSRAFDLAGQNLWIDGNWMNNTGSDPGIDGESILCQAHGGTQLYSWAITRNRHDKAGGEPGYFGAWNVQIEGLLIAWNRLPGWVGGVMTTQAADIAVVANDAGEGVRVPDIALTADPPAAPKPPVNVQAALHGDDAVRVTWRDGGGGAIGYRVERRIGQGRWTTIAYRPPRIQGSRYNEQAWVDFLAPPDKPLCYRVVAVTSRNEDAAASQPTVPLTIPSLAAE